MTEIDSLPPASRTAADAILLWNGQWLGSGEVPEGSATGSLRRVVEQVVAAAPTECRNAEAAGPQFIQVVARDRTMMVVVGSGVWRWADLIASPDECLSRECQSNFEDRQHSLNHRII